MCGLHLTDTPMLSKYSSVLSHALSPLLNKTISIPTILGEARLEKTGNSSAVIEARKKESLNK